MKTETIRKCNTAYCRKSAAPKRKKCWSCTKKAYAERHPIRYAYNNLKHNAKKRNKHFELSFAEFKAFAVATEYYKKKGRKATCYHIDRIDETQGYTRDNIQILTNQENVRKYALFRAEYLDDQRRMDFYTHIWTEEMKPAAVPFWAIEIESSLTLRGKEEILEMCAKLAQETCVSYFKAVRVGINSFCVKWFDYCKPHPDTNYE